MVKNAKHPIDWGLITIKEICKSLNYGTSKKSTFSGKCAVLRMGNLQNGYIDWTDLVYTNDEKDIQKYSLVKGDVLFNRTNSADLVGKTSLYRGEYPAIYAGYLIRLNYDRKKVVGEYLNYILNTQEAKEYCLAVKTDGVSQSNINAQKIGAFLFHLPPFEEQEKISEALSDVDNLIFSLQKLVQKKKAIKQGAMQELLTGKKRLPGFSGEWEKNTLKQICEFINGRAYSQHELLSKGKYKVLRLGNLFTNSHWYYTDLELNEKQYCEKGDLLYAWSASFGPTIWDGEKSVFHYHIWKIKCSEIIDKKYLYHFLNADVSSILNELQGGTMSHLTKENMENRLCSYPNLDEQQAIAKVLSDMDCEVEQLEKKLAKYQQIKQGMMQELLTGRIRLV